MPRFEAICIRTCKGTYKGLSAFPRVKEKIEKVAGMTARMAKCFRQGDQKF